VRLFTPNGHDWTDRFPLITEAALRNRSSSFVIDGETVLLGVDGRSDFNGPHSRRHDDEVQFYAFDLLIEAGEDIRKLPLHLRKASLARLFARRVDGIFLSDFEQGEIPGLPEDADGALIMWTLTTPQAIVFLLLVAVLVTLGWLLVQ
jgi:bifunctional non-homologous end joining protein LigD